MTSTPARSEKRPSVGSIPKEPSQRDHNADASEQASTDSSSFRSSREGAIRRSRSSSSGQSFTLQGVPPLPSGCAQPTNAYYSALHSPYHNGYPFQLPGPMYVQAPPEIRASSLPFMRLDNTNVMPRTSYTSISPPLHSNPPHDQRSQGKRPRPKSLSAHTTSNHNHPALTKHSSQSSIASRDRHHSNHPHPHPSPSPSSHRRRSTSSIQHPPKAHLSRRTSTELTPTLTPGAIPDRESLTKWKSERDEAKADFVGVQRARVKERVRRANEMERVRERELLEAGKGAGGEEEKGEGMGKGMGKRKERGCFGGLFGWGVGRWW
ncbi:hypothetical protein CC86DRAFT_403471 [Ophiobolus disseminans]|uniref:Uncharacterized protein n=1 Tax=Ophiobolus disseminans TaxID=1469910 RepID=A0A6A7ABP9_9PLEO|nr:hypothetical protein CC86DRAFT_403471 [Ophiobolus disseminans]